MDEHLELACKQLQVKVEQVLSWKVYPEDDSISLVVDHGIAGGKKYQLSLSSLVTGEPEADLTSKSTEPIYKDQRAPVDELDQLGDADLKAMAQELGIKNYWSMKRETLIEKVRNAYGS